MLSLHEIAKRGDLVGLRHQLATTDIVCQINAVNKDEESPLYIAAYYGHSVLISPLIKAGGNPYQPEGMFGNTPLFAAIQEGHWQVVKELIANKCCCMFRLV